MKCTHCGYEPVEPPEQDPESFAGWIVYYLAIVIFGTGFVAAGCLIILAYH